MVSKVAATSSLGLGIVVVGIWLSLSLDNGGHRRCWR
jgi:hypothetical protein